MPERATHAMTELSKRVAHFPGRLEYWVGFGIVILVLIVAWHVTVSATDYALRTFFSKRFRRNIAELGDPLLHALHAAVMLVLLSGITYVVWLVLSPFFGPSLTSAGSWDWR